MLSVHLDLLWLTMPDDRCRFSGKERLLCNCGASNCRGFVNKSIDPEEAGLRIARIRLKRFIQPIDGS